MIGCFYFGARTSIEFSWENPFQVYANNLNSTLIALNIARSTKANFVFMSSYVYGPPQYLPIDEAHPLYAVNPYMGSKIAGELICQQISKIYQIPLIILRSFNIYGHFITPGRFISDLVEAFNTTIDLFSMMGHQKEITYISRIFIH